MTDGASHKSKPLEANRAAARSSVHASVTSSKRLRIAFFGAGFVGTPLVQALKERGHDLSVFGRDRFDALVDDAPDLSGFDVVVNLIGTPIDPPWTHRKLRTMHDSRVLSARKLSAAASDAGAFYLQSSGVGRSGILGSLREDWESSVIAQRAAICRFGLVIGDGGLLRSLAPLFRSGFASVFGRGDQTYAWIPLARLGEELVSIIEHQRSGTLELAKEISANEFYRGIARGLDRPCRFHIPEWLLRIMMPLSHELLTASTALERPLVFDDRIEDVVRAL